MEPITHLCRFIFELGHMRRIKHEGWRLALVEAPDSVAEHSLRAAQIAYVLACLEDYPDPSKAATALVFHDMQEARTNDSHKLASRYVTIDKERAARDQIGSLGKIGESIFALWQEVEAEATPLGHILRDADRLECAFTAKEMIETGHAAAQDWIDNIKLYTGSAKLLLSSLRETTSTDWWKGLKKLPK